MELLSSGVWLTVSRVRAIATISGVLGAAMIAYLALAGEGTLDPFGQPIGTDFSAFWHAGRIANGGNPASAWKLEALNAAVQATHSGSDFRTAWVYPPVFLLIAAPLAALPYLPALFLWQALSVVVIAVALGAILKDRRAVLVCLASPLTPMVLAHGQNAFLTAGLLGLGLVSLTQRRAAGAGAFGGLVYKPQLALQLAPLLLFTRNWLALATAAISAMLLIGISVCLWGLGAWIAFSESTAASRHFMEEGSVGFHKSASLFSIARLWGAPLLPAYALQAAGAVAGIALLWRLRSAPAFLLYAGACAAVGLSTPYLLDYDVAVTGIGAAFLYAEARRSGFLTYERTILAYIWAAPWFARQATEVAGLPLLPVSTLLLALFALRRAGASGGAPTDKFHYLQFSVALQQALPPGAGTFYLADLFALRDADRFIVDPSQLQGVAVFPSFHAMLGVMTAAAWRDFPRIRIAMCAWQGLVILSAIPIGGHYASDLVAGGLCWALVQLLWRRIMDGPSAEPSIDDTAPAYA